MPIDLICGNNVDERTARFSSEHNGRKFYFCSRMCKEEFDADPEKFIKFDEILKRDSARA